MLSLVPRRMAGRIRTPSPKARSVPDVDNVYSTSFPSDENPISESSRWRRNQSNGWTNMRTTGGNAIGTQVGNAFDDSYAILDVHGYWGTNYRMTGIIFRDPSISDDNHEVELNMRGADDADSARCYEILLTKDGLIQVFRWEDEFGEFSPEMDSENVGSVPDGALFEVQIVGDIITVRYDSAGVTPAQILTTDITDEPGNLYNDGNPMMAAFCRPALDGSNPAHFGFKSLTVTRLDGSGNPV